MGKIKEKFSALGKKVSENKFLFSELVKRDFKKKYKRTYLGMIWSVLSPLLTLLVMHVVFSQFFGRNVAHYTTYLFCGNIVFSFFSDCTSGGMRSLMDNAGIFSKVNVPKYLFLFSKSTASLINFGLTLVVFFLFCIIDGVPITFLFLALLIPIVLLVVFNIGIGLILSALYMFFRDLQYLWGVFITLLSYLSAIFYTTDSFSPTVQKLFYLNPVYAYIKYFRKIVLEGVFPSIWHNLLILGYALCAFVLGLLIYKKNNHKFLYYI